MALTRRLMLKMALAGGVMLAIFPWMRAKWLPAGNGESKPPLDKYADNYKPIGADDDGLSRVYLAKNGSPEQNIRKAIEMMGGIEKFIGPNDIVVLKPNAQWWNQGMTNTDAMKGFIDMVLAIPGFSGEVIIAENHQYQEANSRGWSTDQRNGKYNLNELVAHYEAIGQKNVTKYHWRAAGKFSVRLQGDAQGDSRVRGPEDGDGYVWMKDCYYLSPAGKKCLMTYPVFTSEYSGITIDLKNGAWRNGRYKNDTKVRFINFSAINYHSWYSGVTASVKNLMGVVDMTCGFPGDEPEGTYNTHHVGVSRLILWTRKRGMWRLGALRWWLSDLCYCSFHHTGGVLGHFIRTVRTPDVNIITADWVGWGSRTDTEKSLHPRAILISRDPVALDYVAARDILCPNTPPDVATNKYDLYYRELNNPDIYNGPFRKFLAETQSQGVGNLNANDIRIVSHDADEQQEG